MAKYPTAPGGPLEPGEVRRPKGFESEKELKQPPEAERFKSYMGEEKAAPQAESAKGPTPLELPREGATPAIEPTINTITQQVDNTNSTIDNIRNNLNTPNLRFKKAHERLLENKLSDARSHLSIAAEKMGADKIPLSEFPEDAGPVTKFLGYLTDGQNQLNAAKKHLKNLAANGEQLSPSEMMLVQIKISQAQQEIEYSSVLLSKVVDFIKQTMSTQI